MHKERVTLRKILSEHFNVTGIQIFCFDLGIDDETFRQTTKDTFALDFITYLERSGQVDNFIIYLSRNHYNIYRSYFFDKNLLLEPKDFVDRTNPLEQIQNKEKQRLMIDSPSGYGKTYLLKRLKHLVKEDNKCASYIELRSDLNCENAIKIISKHLIDEETTDLQTLVSYLHKKATDAFILLDSCEENLEVASYLCNTFFGDLLKRFNQGNPKSTIKIVCAGRGICLDNQKWPYFKKLHLNKFDFHAAEELIEKLLEENQKKRIFSDTINNTAIEIATLTGGHPDITSSTIKHVIKNEFSVIWERDSQEIFGTKVKPQLIKLVKLFSERETQYRPKRDLTTTKSILQKICIFRIINSAILENCVNNVFMEELTTKGIAFRIGGIYYIDPILRGLILSEMRLFEDQNLELANLNAKKLFDRWLEDESSGNNLATDDNCVDFIVESFYHFLESISNSQITELRLVLERHFKSHIKAFKGTDSSNRANLASKLGKDLDIKHRLLKLGIKHEEFKLCIAEFSAE